MKTPSAKQVEAARALGIVDPERMSQYDLSRAMDGCPATKAQVGYVTDVLAALGKSVPADLTYGQAGRLLDELAPRVNENTLLDHGWAVGTVVQWRDGYYRIKCIHRDFRFTLERVELVRHNQQEPAEVHTTATCCKVHNPFTLHSDNATTVDLMTVQP